MTTRGQINACLMPLTFLYGLKFWYFNSINIVPGPALYKKKQEMSHSIIWELLLKSHYVKPVCDV